jgi:ATP-dependent DNA helicase RecG
MTRDPRCRDVDEVMANLWSVAQRRASLSYPLFHPARPGDLPVLLSPDDFARAFPAENELIELKTGLSERRLQEAAVAFSNANGGVYVVGVAPDGRVLGVSQPGEKAKDIHQAMRDVRDPGRYDVHELQVGDATVLVLAIARRHEGFSQTSSGAVLARRGASNVPLLGAELSRFLAGRAFQSFELTPTTAEFPEDGSQDLLRQLVNAYGWDQAGLDDQLLIQEGMCALERGAMVLTVAGSLLLLPDPTSVGGRPYVEIRRYAANQPDPDRVWRIQGPITEQVERATTTVVDELGSVSVIIGAKRVEMPKIPPRVIREALANAVAHRSYENAGSAVHVDITPTQVAVTSPGTLPEPVTIENIRFQQAARNDRVLGALRRFGLAEDLGKGVDRMQDDMAAELLEAPEFAEDGSFFTVTLRLGGVVTPRERAWVRELVRAGRLDPRGAAIVVAVARHGETSNSDVRSMLDIDSVAARSLLQTLVSSGVLVRRGQRGGARYVLAPEIGIPTNIRHTDAELDEIALRLARAGAVTNAQLRAETGIDRQLALRTLRRLADAGKLVQHGTKRGTSYRLPVL